MFPYLLCRIDFLANVWTAIVELDGVTALKLPNILTSELLAYLLSFIPSRVVVNTFMCCHRSNLASRWQLTQTQTTARC